MKGDVLLAIVGATLGKVAFVEDMEPFHIQRSLAVFRPFKNKMDYRLLTYFMRSSFFQELLWNNVGFSAQPGIYLGALGNFSVTCPAIEAQQEIVSFLDRELGKISDSIKLAENQIQLLQEYRTTLISDAVTGKIDIREEAA